MTIFKRLPVMAGLILVLANSLSAQSIKGYIYDSQTRQPLAGACLKTLTDSVLTTSANNGSFAISDIYNGKRIKVTAVGYITQFINASTAANANIQMDADATELSEVHVTGFTEGKTSRETPGAIALITQKDINRGNGISLQPALNTIPGVRMDQSTLADSRISIRGNGVRAQWGIRAVKIYLNDIPVTETDGTTRIEAIDVNGIGRAEIIKGPASSIYGAGAGGVINFNLQRSPYQEQSVEASALTGTYGLHRVATTYRSGGDQVNSFVSYGWQEYAGYRRHGNDMRRFITGNFQLFPSDKRIVTLLLNRSTQHSSIPGSLTLNQVNADPRQANATNLDKAAGRYQNWTRIGLGQQYRFNNQLSNSTSVFTYFYDLNHPLPYAYIRNTYQSYGGRTRFMYNPEFNTLPTRFTAGAEYNQGFTKGAQYVNNQGTEGAINSNVDYSNTLYTLFFQSETELGSRTTLTLGVSYNNMKYNARDYLKPNQSGIKKFDPQASPRIALSHKVSDGLTLHGSVSTGFTAPTSSEIRTVDGSINQTLQAEKAINYELDAKGDLFSKRLGYDLSLFMLNMKGELIAQTVQQGITIYNNAGKTTHNGVELALSWRALQLQDGKVVTMLRPFVAVTYSAFKFNDYKILNAGSEVTATFDNNKLTGIAPWVINAGIDMETKIGIYFFGNYFFNDKLPVNDANTVYAKAYKLINTKIGYRRKLGSHFNADVFGGIDNLSNSNYSSLVSLNAVGFGGAQPAYFNPSPKRNGYGGINIKYIF